MLDIVTKGKPHLIATKTEDEKTEWYNAINKALEKCSQNILEGTERFGYLKMKGQRRFVLLSEGRLSWWGSPTDVVEKGSVYMEYCKVRHDEIDNLTLVVYSTVDANQVYQFTCANSDECVAPRSESICGADRRPFQVRRVVSDFAAHGSAAAEQDGHHHREAVAAVLARPHRQERLGGVQEQEALLPPAGRLLDVVR